MLRKNKTAPSVRETLRKVDKRNDRSYYGIKINVNLNPFVLVLRALVCAHVCTHATNIKTQVCTISVFVANDRIYDVCIGCICPSGYSVCYTHTEVWPHHTYLPYGVLYSFWSSSLCMELHKSIWLFPCFFSLISFAFIFFTALQVFDHRFQFIANHRYSLQLEYSAYKKLHRSSRH